MTLSTQIPETGVPFSRREYERRCSAVLARFDETEIDALAVTANTHQQYLTGYSGRGDYFAPFPLVLAPNFPPTYVVRAYDEDAVRAESWIEEVVLYRQQGDLPRVWADVLRGFGLARARLGLELDSWNLAPADVARLQAELPGMVVVDATKLVPSVAAVKSAEELDLMRESMVLTRLALKAFQASLAEGVTELEVAASMNAAIVAGGGYQSEELTLVFGRRSALPHGGPTGNRLQRNQVAFTEVAGWKHGYAAGLCRTAVLGRHSAAESLHTIAEEALQAAIEAIRPGATAGEIDAACRKVIERAGRAETFRHRAGYQNGIGWSYRGDLSLEPNASDVLRVGMTLHLPINLFEQGEFGVGCSQSVIVTESGAEILSGLSTEIYHA